MRETKAIWGLGVFLGLLLCFSKVKAEENLGISKEESASKAREGKGKIFIAFSQEKMIYLSV